MDKKLLTLHHNDELIHGIMYKSECTQNEAIIFLHGWGGYRVGPHDMFVKYAYKLAKMGYCCIRFDFRGRGYSGNIDPQISPSKMLEDVEIIYDYTQNELGYDKISLLGICSGAKIAIYFAMNTQKPLHNIITLSTPPLRIGEDTRTLAFYTSMDQAESYFRKVFHRKTWNKLINGEVNFKKIFINITHPLKLFFTEKKTLSAHNNKSNKVKVKFNSITGYFLLIYGEKDPESSISIKQCSQLLKKYNIGYNCHVIPGANHSYYSIKWENEIFDIVSQWLLK